MRKEICFHPVREVQGFSCFAVELKPVRSRAASEGGVSCRTDRDVMIGTTDEPFCDSVIQSQL